MMTLADSTVRTRRKLTPLEGTLLALILATSAFLDFWNLQANGWANAYYSAAVQAGLHDPVAFFFGSSDWGNAISVDKPPLSLWLMGASVRILGLNTWGILLPQALLGVATTALVFALGRRHLSPVAGLAGAAVFATTPIVVLMSRYNNPDPLMMFLLLLALAAGLRAVETDRWRWAVAVGLLLGLAVLAKQLQALLVVPALATVLVAGQWGRLRSMLAMAGSAATTFILTSASWFTVVELTPKENRPYVGGSMSNSVVELTFGYNGLQRIVTQDDPIASLIPAQYREGTSDTGILRLINGNYAQEAGWLLAAACAGTLLIAVALRRLPLSTSRPYAVAGVVWFSTTFAMLSFMGEQIHTYYTASLGVPVALVTGAAVHVLVRHESQPHIRVIAAIGTATSALVATAILLSVAIWPPSMAWLVLGAGLLSSILIAVRPPWRFMNHVAACLATASLLAAPVSTSVLTVLTPQQGSNPLSGGTTISDKTISRFLADVRKGDPVWARDIAMGNDPQPDLIRTVAAADDSCTWGAAALPSQSAAKLQLESGRSVLPIGGFSAVDPWPTLGRFKIWASEGRICYFVDDPAMDPALVSSPQAREIVGWIRSTYSGTSLGGVRVYRLG